MSRNVDNFTYHIEVHFSSFFVSHHFSTFPKKTLASLFTFLPDVGIIIERFECAVQFAPVV